MKNIIKVTIFALLCAGQSSGMMPGALPPVAGAVVPQTPDAQAIALINNLGGIVQTTGATPLTAAQLDAVAAHVGTLKRVTGTLAGHLEQQDSALVKVGRWLNKHKFKLLAGTVTAATLAGIIYYLYVHWDDQAQAQETVAFLKKASHKLYQKKEAALDDLCETIAPLEKALQETQDKLEDAQELLKIRSNAENKLQNARSLSKILLDRLDSKNTASPLYKKALEMDKKTSEIKGTCSGMFNWIKTNFSAQHHNACQILNDEVKTLVNGFNISKNRYIQELAEQKETINSLTKKLFVSPSQAGYSKINDIKKAIDQLTKQKTTLEQQITPLLDQLTGRTAPAHYSALEKITEKIKENNEALEYAEHIALNQVPQQWAPWVRTKLTEIIAGEKFKPLTKTAAFLPPLAYAGFNRLASGSWFTPGAGYARKGAVITGNIAYSAAVTYLAYLMTQAAGGA